MSLADLLPGRFGPGGRLPHHLADLHGPGRGVLMMPSYLSLPGMRECDVSDGESRHAMYRLLLTQGNRNDVARLVNADLLSQDWPELSASLSPGLSRWCERQLGLAGPGTGARATGGPRPGTGARAGAVTRRGGPSTARK